MPNPVITDVKLHEAAQPRTLRVMVVDDDRDLVLSLTTLLRMEGHDARGLHEATDIVRQVRAYDPDVVILDIAMPGKNGWDAAKELRADPAGRRLVLVGVSGEHMQAADRRLSEINGFDLYLMKPCDPNSLLMLLRWVRIESPFRTRFR